MKYYYKAYGRENGPDTLENIQRFAWVNHSGSDSKKAISGDTLVRAENSAKWVKLSEVHGAKGMVPTKKDQPSPLAVPILAQDDDSISTPDPLRMSQADSPPIQRQPASLIPSIQSTASPRQTGEPQQQYQQPQPKRGKGAWISLWIALGLILCIGGYFLVNEDSKIGGRDLDLVSEKAVSVVNDMISFNLLRGPNTQNPRIPTGGNPLDPPKCLRVVITKEIVPNSYYAEAYLDDGVVERISINVVGNEVKVKF